MIRAGHFYGDDKVFDVMLFDGLFERQHGELKAAAIVLNVRWWIEYVAIEIGEHPFRSSFCTVHGDDAELLWPDGLHAFLDGTLRSAEHSVLVQRKS